MEIRELNRREEREEERKGEEGKESQNDDVWRISEILPQAYNQCVMMGKLSGKDHLKGMEGTVSCTHREQSLILKGRLESLLIPGELGIMHKKVFTQ